MHKDINPMQQQPWHERMDKLLREADRIARDYQRPTANDANGILDCYKLSDKLGECIHILNRYKK